MINLSYGGSFNEQALVRHIPQSDRNYIIQVIYFYFSQISKKYDFKKYPKCVYDRCKLKFSALNPANQDIRDALVWKYGHWGKSGFPCTHHNLIRAVQKSWPQFIKTGKHHSPCGTFQWWESKLPKTSYITVAFITHLIHHKSGIPIIDQHNFRAMNALIYMVNENHRYKKRPSSWQDILDLKDFMAMLLPHLNAAPSVKNVDRSELDRFLMIWGKCVKKK